MKSIRKLNGMFTIVFDSYLNVGGGFPCAEHVKCMSLSLSAKTTVWTVGANLGGMLPVGSGKQNRLFFFRVYVCLLKAATFRKPYFLCKGLFKIILVLACFIYRPKSSV